MIPWIPALFLLLAAAPAEAALLPKPDGLPGEDPPSPTLTPAVVARHAGMRPRWEFLARPGLWVLPGTAGTANLDRPAWRLEAGMWKGLWGLEGGVTAFGELRAPFRAAPYFQPSTLLTDVLVSRRFEATPYRAFAGYRGLGRGDLNFLTVGGAMDSPLKQPGFRLVARAQLGADFAGSLVADGEIGLGYRVGALALEGGLRHLALSAAGDPWLHLTGPTLSLSGRF
ncbi:MAG: hypothetical protein ACLGIN_09805 [Candidatus Sericytochromatia bacterium]